MCHFTRVLLLLLLWSFPFLGCAEGSGESSTFDAQRAFALLEKQCAFGPRIPGTPAHAATRDYLVDTLKDATSDVQVQAFEVDVRGKRLLLSNIIASFGPKDAIQWILAAHWDSRPTADHDPDPANRSKPILGANDGASGVAVLLEIARVLGKTPPRAGVQIVLFDGEDYGPEVDTMFLGSTHFAKHLKAPKPQHGILLDMVGDEQLNLPMEVNSYEAAPHLTKHIWDTAQALGIGAFERRLGYRISDDHLPLIAAGVPTVDIIDFDYPYWHTLADTPDKCSPASLLVVGQVVLSVLGYSP